MKILSVIAFLHLMSMPIYADGYFSDQKDSITVYFFLLEDCKICQYYTDEVNEIYNEFKDENTGFVGLFPNRFSSEENISDYKEKYEVPFELKREFFQTKTKDFEVTITPTVVVFNETKEKIIYKGRIDNSYVGLGKRRRVVTSFELRDVLSKIKKGSQLDTVEFTESIGCFITLN